MVTRLLRHENVVGVDEENGVVFVVGDVPLGFERYRVVRLSGIPHVLAGRKGRFRPVVFGVSAGHVDITAGTLGWVVRDRESNERLFLSNAHVFHPKPWEGGDPARKEIIQPGRFDGGGLQDVIGYYQRHVPIKLSSTSTCPVARGWAGVYNVFARLLRRKTRLVPVAEETNRVDAAVALPVANYRKYVLGSKGKRIKPKSVVGLLFAGSEQDNIYLVSKAGNIEEELGVVFDEDIAKVGVGDRVYKCGRTTGCGEGEVVATSATMKVFYLVGFAVFEDVVVVSGRSAGGDSGSLVWVE